MKVADYWQVYMSLFLVSLVSGVNIWYRCHSDQECWEGNGGKYSRCDTAFSRCLCKYNHFGEVLDTTSPVLFCNDKAVCWAPFVRKDLWRYHENKDWYGPHSKPFVSLFVHDNDTSVCYDPDRAISSRPKGIVIKTSGIPDAGLGAFTEEYIPRGTVIGPYKGIKVYDDVENLDYSWAIQFESVNSIHAVDASDPSLSNWLRYINCANSAESQTFHAFQYQGEFYYYAFKPILPGSELLVYYGDAYAKRLGLRIYERPKYTFEKDGHAGGKCLKRQYNFEVECYSVNTLCIRNICMCRHGTHFRAGSCLTDEQYRYEDGLSERNFGCDQMQIQIQSLFSVDESQGGKCHGKNGDICQNDKNAECQKGVCICNSNSTELNGKCVHDETYGGVCIGRNGENCQLDKNAECVNRICSCKFGASEVRGECFMDIQTKS